MCLSVFFPLFVCLSLSPLLVSPTAPVFVSKILWESLMCHIYRLTSCPISREKTLSQQHDALAHPEYPASATLPGKTEPLFFLQTYRQCVTDLFTATMSVVLALAFV